MKCPECDSGRVYRSRARTLRDRALKRLLPITFYRCHECGWRRMRSRKLTPGEVALQALSIVGYIGSICVVAAILAAIIYLTLVSLGLPMPWSK